MVTIHTHFKETFIESSWISTFNFHPFFSSWHFLKLVPPTFPEFAHFISITRKAFSSCEGFNSKIKLSVIHLSFIDYIQIFLLLDPRSVSSSQFHFYQALIHCHFSTSKRTTIVVSNGRYTFYQIHFIKHNLSNTIYRIPFIQYLLSNTIYQILFIKYLLSNILYQILFVKYHLSNTI